MSEPATGAPRQPATNTMIHIAFLIRSLERGGAQRQLVELARGLPKDQFRVSVITFYPGGTLERDLAGQPGVRLFSLGKRARWDLLPFGRRLWSLLRELRPEIVHGYMGTANELALLFGRLVGARVVWGLRASNMELADHGRLARWMFTLGALLSHFADAIIVNSHDGKRYHSARGYAARRMLVIPNGIDTDSFQPRPQERRRIRSAWGIRDDEPLIGIVARLDPMKDHPTFLRAAACLARDHPQAHFVCVGDGPPRYTRELHALANQLGLDTTLRWAGARDDMPAIYGALDIATSASAFGEGFSNAVAEAIACGVPCVATDVGDAAIIVGDAARIVPPGDPPALAAAWSRLLRASTEERAQGTTPAQERIMRSYSRATLVARTSSVLLQIV
jgi:glycosyltransferase involved in cell wall biosynthesis